MEPATTDGQGSPRSNGAAGHDEPLSLDRFAVAFLQHAAGPERVCGIVRDLLGDRIELGPVPAGPRGIASAKAIGTVGSVHGRTVSPDGTRMVVQTEVDVHITVRVAGRTARFEAAMVNTSRIGLRLVRPLAMVIDVAPMTDDDIALDLAAPAMVRRLLERVGNLEAEVRRHTREYVDELVGSDRAAALTRIDIAGLVDRAWSTGIVPGGAGFSVPD